MPAIISRLCLLAFVCFAALSPSASYAQGKITLQRDGQSTYYPSDSLQAALDDAQDGDMVLLPGGTFTGEFNLNKRISLIGVGFHSDSTAATSASIIAGSVRLTSAASNSYISGIRITTYMTGSPSSTRVDNVIIHRCDVGSGISNFHPMSSGWVMSESILRSLSNMKSPVIRNCVIVNQLYDLSNALVDFCIFLDSGTGTLGKPIQNCKSCSIQGCVFTQSLGNIAGTSSQWSHAINNIFVSATIGGNVSGYENILGADPMALFVTYNGQSYWNSTMDFHLAPNSPAIGAGPGGTDCGIYGGPSPWKEGSVPITPHIQEQIIGTTTSPTGGLPVQIRVSAQDR